MRFLAFIHQDIEIDSFVVNDYFFVILFLKIVMVDIIKVECDTYRGWVWVENSSYPKQ